MNIGILNIFIMHIYYEYIDDQDRLIHKLTYGLLLTQLQIYGVYLRYMK